MTNLRKTAFMVAVISLAGPTPWCFGSDLTPAYVERIPEDEFREIVSITTKIARIGLSQGGGEIALFPGRSGTAFATLLSLFQPESVFEIPFTGVKRPEDLSNPSVMESVLDEIFSKVDFEAVGTVTLFDFAVTGDGLLAFQTVLTDYLNERGHRPQFQIIYLAEARIQSLEASPAPFFIDLKKYPAVQLNLAFSDYEHKAKFQAFDPNGHRTPSLNEFHSFFRKRLMELSASQSQLLAPLVRVLGLERDLNCILANPQISRDGS